METPAKNQESVNYEQGPFRMICHEEHPFLFEVGAPVSLSPETLKNKVIDSFTATGKAFSTKWSVKLRSGDTARQIFSNVQRHINQYTCNEFVVDVLLERAKKNIYAYFELRVTKYGTVEHDSEDKRTFTVSKSVDYRFPNPAYYSECSAMTVSGCVKVLVHTYISSMMPVPPENEESKLANALQSVFISDIVRLEVQGTILHAHHHVLVANSPVFAAMFEHEMCEKQTNRIKLEDFDANIISSILTYMYMGRCPDFNYEKAAKLLEAAEKYAIAKLKEMCEVYLMSMLTTENAVEIFLHADMHNAAKLKQAALNNICDNPHVFKDEKSFSCLAHRSDLLMKVISKMAEYMDAKNKGTKV